MVGGKQCELTISHSSDRIDPKGLFKFSSEFIENTADAYVIVYGMEDSNDLPIVQQYLRMARSKKSSGYTTPIFIVSSKRDLWADRDRLFHKYYEIRDIARKEGVPFVPTMVNKKGKMANVDRMFCNLVKLMRLEIFFLNRRLHIFMNDFFNFLKRIYKKCDNLD